MYHECGRNIFFLHIRLWHFFVLRFWFCCKRLIMHWHKLHMPGNIVNFFEWIPTGICPWKTLERVFVRTMSIVQRVWIQFSFCDISKLIMQTFHFNLSIVGNLQRKPLTIATAIMSHCFAVLLHIHTPRLHSETRMTRPETRRKRYLTQGHCNLHR